MKRYVMLFLILALSLTLAATLSQAATDLFDDAGLGGTELHSRLSALASYGEDLPRGEALSFEHTILDTVQAPFFLVVPPDYDGSRDWPLLVWLHGGVSTPDFFDEYMLEMLEKRPPDDYFMAADSLGRYIHLYPLARHDCMWWDTPGMDNILWQIRYVKDHLRVDDDRVFISGGSDGGSGSYHLAQVRPDAFAAFLPHIGMVSVGASMTQTTTYPVNLCNRPLRAVNNEFDRLYPARNASVQVSAMRAAGAEIAYASYGFGHDMNYWPDEEAAQTNFLATRVRDPLQPELVWECDARGVGGGVDWLAVTALDTTLAARSWHKVYQDSLVDTRISFGFFPNENVAAMGIYVDSLVSGDSPVRAAGLQAGDVIIQINGRMISSLDNINDIKSSCKRGDSFTITVSRDGEKLTLEGVFPPPKRHPVFLYDDHVSGRVNARYADNRFDLETSCVAAVELKLHPQMVDMTSPVEVWVNGAKVWAGRPSYNRGYMRANFERNLDRRALWAGRIEVSIPAEMR
ncbi:MAG: PDZ domain-containing protein [Candidatus Cloacimonetes bacterium]|nr:PDZ domain-containing protein [Candidatus Cloacimonadota bacterium]